MAKKKAVRARAVPVGELADLTEAETDLVSHMEQGWRLETDSLGGNPVLRSLKDDKVIRPLSRTEARWRRSKSGGSLSEARDANRSRSRGG